MKVLESSGLTIELLPNHFNPVRDLANLSLLTSPDVSAKPKHLCRSGREAEQQREHLL